MPTETERVVFIRDCFEKVMQAAKERDDYDAIRFLTVAIPSMGNAVFGYFSYRSSELYESQKGYDMQRVESAILEKKKAMDQAIRVAVKTLNLCNRTAREYGMDDIFEDTSQMSSVEIVKNVFIPYLREFE